MYSNNYLGRMYRFISWYPYPVQGGPEVDPREGAEAAEDRKWRSEEAQVRKT